MMRAIDAALPGRGDRAAGPPPGMPDRLVLPVVDRQLPAGRPQRLRHARPVARHARPDVHDPRLLGARRARRTAATGRGRRGTPARPRRTATRASSVARGCRAGRRRVNARSIKRFNATLVTYLFLLYFDTRAGYCDTGPYAVPGHPNRRAARTRLLPARAERLLVERCREGRAVSEPHRRVRPRRRRLHRDRLRHVESRTHRLPRPRRRLRAVHDRRLRARRASSRGARRDSTRSSPPYAARRHSTTAASPRWSATRRSDVARTCTSRSSGRSR